MWPTEPVGRVDKGAVGQVLLADSIVLTVALLRSAGVLLVIALGWWWCFVFGLRLRLAAAIGLTALLAGVGAVAGDLCFDAIVSAVG